MNEFVNLQASGFLFCKLGIIIVPTSHEIIVGSTRDTEVKDLDHYLGVCGMFR